MKPKALITAVAGIGRTRSASRSPSPTAQAHAP